LKRHNEYGIGIISISTLKNALYLYNSILFTILSMLAQ
jgi:hypothetical protein